MVEFLSNIFCYFLEKLAEALRRFGEIELEVANAGVERLQKVTRSNTISAADKNETNDDNAKAKAISNKKKLKEMKAVVGEFYLSLVLLQNYQVVR